MWSCAPNLTFYHQFFRMDFGMHMYCVFVFFLFTKFPLKVFEGYDLFILLVFYRGGFLGGFNFFFLLVCLFKFVFVCFCCRLFSYCVLCFQCWQCLLIVDIWLPLRFFHKFLNHSYNYKFWDFDILKQYIIILD